MANITLKGNPCNTSGDLPEVGATAPPFTLTSSDLEDVSLAAWAGKKKLISIFPSIDTPVCAVSTKKFNDHARANADTVMLMVSADLPFAQKRFCGDEELDNVQALSSFRHPEFGTDYGIEIVDGPLRGVLGRAVLVLDADDKVIHAELVGEIGNEPDYEAAIAALG